MHFTIGSARAGLVGLLCLLGGLTGACGGADHDSTERDTAGTCDNGAITAPGIAAPASGGGSTSPPDPGSGSGGSTSGGSGAGSTSGGSTSGGSTSGGSTSGGSTSGGGSDGALCGPGASCRGITSCRNACFGTECCVADCYCGSSYPNSADALLTCSLNCSK